MNISINIYDENHLDSVWYDEEEVARIELDENHYASIIATGEINAYVDVGIDEECFEDVRDVANGDSGLMELAEQHKIWWQNNNWYEIQYIINNVCIESEILEISLLDICSVEFIKEIRNRLGEIEGAVEC